MATKSTLEPTVIRKFGVSFHMYAEDVQLYITFDPKDPASITAALDRLARCINVIKIWMNENMLKLNDDKSEFFVAIASHIHSIVPTVSLRASWRQLHLSI